LKIFFFEELKRKHGQEFSLKTIDYFEEKGLEVFYLDPVKKDLYDIFESLRLFIERVFFFLKLKNIKKFKKRMEDHLIIWNLLKNYKKNIFNITNSLIKIFTFKKKKTKKSFIFFL